jgi:hypothetical protein
LFKTNYKKGIKSVIKEFILSRKVKLIRIGINSLNNCHVMIIQACESWGEGELSSVVSL